MGKVHHDPNKIRQFGPKEPFVMLPRELLISRAWRTRSIHCIRLIDFLLVEHMAHAGRENGFLMATYDQLEAAGIGRRYIHEAITEAEQLGLILVERGGRRGFALSHANKFTVTFLRIKIRQKEVYYYGEPTNDWKRLEPLESEAEEIQNQSAKGEP
jgi:hypothetical protein